MIASLSLGVEIRGIPEEKFLGIFAKRYIPEIGKGGKKEAEVEWKVTEEKAVRVEEMDKEKERYVVKGAPPAPYENENPYFFLLQLFSRLYEKKGMVMFNDCAVFAEGKKGVLVIGAPHSGKSTLMALAIDRGLVPLANENAVFKVRKGELIFEGGATALTFSKKVAEKIGIDIEEDGRTRSGYGIVNLEKFRRNRVKIELIAYPHSSMLSSGLDMREIKGRKREKILWSHASRVIHGLEFYRFPPDLSDAGLDMRRALKVADIADRYEGRFLEIFGGYLEIFHRILELLQTFP